MKNDCYLKGDFALICENQNCIILDTITNKIFTVKNKMKEDFLAYFINDIYNKEVINELNKEKNNIFIQKSQDCILCTNLEPKKFQINKLVLVLTSKCNLRCKYCYANYGKYDFQNDIDMSYETLISGLNYFTENFKGISKIQFFGGEPTLREDLIIATVNYFSKFKIKPSFGMVTNGVSISDNLINVMSKHRFHVTVSIDGPENINDKLRVNCNNDGTFNKIVSTYMRMHNANIQLAIESTYTAEHIRNKVSIIDLIKYFATNFNCDIPHIAPVSVDDDSNLSLKRYLDDFGLYIDDLVDYVFDNIINGDKSYNMAIFGGILSRIFNQKSQDAICPAGLKTFSYAKDRKVSPCFLYTSKEDISYGTIQDDPEKIMNNAINFNRKINSKKCSVDCQNCFAKGVCSSCLGLFNIENDIPVLNDDATCFLIKRLVKKSYIKLTMIYSNEHIKEKFLKNICKTT